MKNFWVRNVIAIAVSVAALFGVYMLVNHLPGEETKKPQKSTSSEEKTLPDLEPPETEETEPAAPDANRVRLMAIGDMLMHVQVSGKARQADGSYNYDFLYEPIKKELAEADLKVVNNEVPFGGNRYGLRGYPSFNCFTELGDAEAKAGFNIILNATNHVNDMGYAGIQNGWKFWEKYPEITQLGLNKTRADVNKLVIKEVNGIKIAMFNYTYGINAGIPAEAPYTVNLMTKDTIDKMKAEIMRAEREADFTIVFPHWGEEYHLKWSPGQEYYARLFTEWGADLIIGTHSHCIEPIRTITADNGNKSLCYFSLGNYVSLQDETVASIGGLAQVTIVKDEKGTRIESHDMQFLVNHYEAGLDFAEVYRLEDYTEALARKHGIVVHQLNGGELNFNYPFSLATLKSIIANVMSDNPKDTVGTHIEQRWGDKTTEAPTETSETASTEETESESATDESTESSGESDESTEPSESSEPSSSEESSAPSSSEEPEGSSEPED